MQQIERFTSQSPELIERADGYYLSGYAMVWYNGTPETEFSLGENRVERIKPTALDRVLSSGETTELRFNHSRDFVLDSTKRTLRLEVDSKGLKYTSPIDTNDPDYAKVRSKLQKGFVKGSSFVAFVSYQWKPEGTKDVAWITDISRLLDVSVVDSPAYTGTTAIIRSEDLDYQEYQKAKEETQKRINAAKLLK